jgi:predicted house-cleaning NTP pyrophosphatase (Maf/HAM1 superfamily)
MDPPHPLTAGVDGAADFSSPVAFATHLARCNTEATLANTGNLEDLDVVLGVASVVMLDGEVLERPRDLVEAKEVFRRLSGRAHTVLTALTFHMPTGALLPLSAERDAEAVGVSAAPQEYYDRNPLNPRVHTVTDATTVRFAELTDAVADAMCMEWIATGGAPSNTYYDAQGPAAASFIAGIDGRGCFLGAVGLPLHRFSVELVGLAARDREGTTRSTS